MVRVRVRVRVKFKDRVKVVIVFAVDAVTSLDTVEGCGRQCF